MSDLKVLEKMLKQARTSPHSSWKYEDYQRKTLQKGITMSLGCPDGKSGYVQFMFNLRGRLIEAKAIDKRGNECRCKYCKDTNDES
jgi:hypothetical protein